MSTRATVREKGIFFTLRQPPYLPPAPFDTVVGCYINILFIIIIISLALLFYPSSFVLLVLFVLHPNVIGESAKLANAYILGMLYVHMCVCIYIYIYALQRN